MTEKMIGIWVSEELWEEVGVISKREHKPIKTIGKELFEKLVKEHGDGNPNYDLDQWTDNSQMLAIPAVMRTLPEWQEYIDKLSEKDYRDLEPQIQALKSKMDKRWEKGW